MLMNDKTLEMVAQRFRVLGDPLRLRLLNALSERERSVTDLVQETGASQANVSKHLAVLLQEGLIDRRKDGLFVFYACSDLKVFQICDVVCGSLRERLTRDLSQLRGGRRPRRGSGKGGG
jgi:DNA-binding transcriptional ArsR family regulator